MAPRVLVSQYVFPEAVDELRVAGFDVVARELDTPMPYSELRASLRGIDGLVCLLSDRIDAALLAAAPRLAVVANVAVGFDNIDTAAATDLGIAVCNTPGVLTAATADLTMALMLATARRVPEGDAFLRGGRYTHWKLDQEQLGLDITGKRLGIFGFGLIGRAVARRAVGGFGMQVTYFSRNRLDPAEEERLGVAYGTMDELLETSDVLSIHTPLTPQTRHAIDAQALSLMKPSAILVNTARGPIVDEAALADALAAGVIAGAGLDVYEHEPVVHPLLLEMRERVVLLPHLGSATVSTRYEMARIAVRNVVDALTGGRPRTMVNPEVFDKHGALRSWAGV